MSVISYRLIRSSRRTIGLEIRDGALLVRAPRWASRSEIEALIRQKENWILPRLAESQRKAEMARDIVPLSLEELNRLADQALAYIPGRVRLYAEKLGVHCGRITIRNQKTRWGSCSSKGNLNFNCLLMLTPPEVIDSVVVHELCHLKEMNHSPRFYEAVYSVYPDYDRCYAWLKEHETELLARLR